jgi:hypothetical protein
MTDTATVSRNHGDWEPVRPALIDEQLADQLLGKAQAEGVELLGPDGLLSRLAERGHPANWPAVHNEASLRASVGPRPVTDR